MKFIGQFNYQSEIFNLVTEAKTERQAWRHFCYGLAKRLSVQERVMRNYFNGTKDNYKIREA